MSLEDILVVLAKRLTGEELKQVIKLVQDYGRQKYDEGYDQGFNEGHETAHDEIYREERGL